MLPLKLKDLAVFPIWPSRLGTSNVETDKEIGLWLSASHSSVKSACWSLQRIHSLFLRYDPVSMSDPTFILQQPWSQSHRLQSSALKAHEAGFRLEIWGSCVPHLSALIPHGEVSWGKRSEVGGFPLCFVLLLWSLAAPLEITWRCFDELTSDRTKRQWVGGISVRQVSDDERQQISCCQRSQTYCKNNFQFLVELQREFSVKSALKTSESNSKWPCFMSLIVFSIKPFSLCRHVT